MNPTHLTLSAPGLEMWNLTMPESNIDLAQPEAHASDKPRIRLPLRHSPTLQKVIDRVNGDEEMYAL